MARHRRRAGRGRRAPLRKFVWARSFGTLGFSADPATTFIGADLLGNFQSEYGAQLLGATVVRVRGFIAPGIATAGADSAGYAATVGMIVDKDRDPATGYILQGNEDLAVEQREHDDWMAYLPFTVQNPSDVRTDITWNTMASPYAVDIKSSRKIEELGQTLQLWTSTPPADNPDLPGIGFHLSVGLKLP